MLHLALVAGSLTAPAVALAQGPINTGVGAVGTVDPNWQSAIGDGPFGAAYILDRTGGTVGVDQWIGVSPSGTLPGGQPDQTLSRFLYSFRTSFLGGAVTGVTYQCARDDSFFSVLLNGATVSGAGCPDYSLGSSFTISGFNVGTNTLQFNTGGNGVTDGLLVNFTQRTLAVMSTPEPSSIVLLATGLAGVIGAARRRKNGRSA